MVYGPTPKQWRLTLKFEREQLVRKRIREGNCACCGQRRGTLQKDKLHCATCLGHGADIKFPISQDVLAWKGV